MLDPYDDDEIAANAIERRWFAASAKVKAMQDECDVLREVMSLAEESWRSSRTRLAELEKLRDALGERLATADAGSMQPSRIERGHGVLSGYISYEHSCRQPERQMGTKRPVPMRQWEEIQEMLQPVSHGRFPGFVEGSDAGDRTLVQGP